MKMTVTTQVSPQANPSRGYHDYIMKISFESWNGSSLIEEMQKAYAVMLHDHLMKQKYMWCYPPKKTLEVKEDNGWATRTEWEIRYGYDSGD